MSTTSILTQGSVIKRGDGGSPEVFTAITQATTISGPGGQSSEINVSTLDSTAMEFRMGLQDNGQLTFDVIFDPADAQQTGLRTDRTNQTLRNFQVVMPDTTTLSFAANVMGFVWNAAGDDVWKSSVTLRVSGEVTES